MQILLQDAFGLEPFKDVLEQGKLPQNLQSVILYCLAMLDCEQHIAGKPTFCLPLLLGAMYQRNLQMIRIPPGQKVLLHMAEMSPNATTLFIFWLTEVASQRQLPSESDS